MRARALDRIRRPCTETPDVRRAVLLRVLGLSSIVFGVATLLAGGIALFGGPAAEAVAGDVVSFVLVFNFLAGLAYVAAGVAAIRRRICSVLLARLLAAATAMAFVGLGLHIAAGGAFELRTVVAMTVRVGFWTGQAVALSRSSEYGRGRRAGADEAVSS